MHLVLSLTARESLLPAIGALLNSVWSSTTVCLHHGRESTSFTAITHAGSGHSHMDLPTRYLRDKPKKVSNLTLFSLLSSLSSPMAPRPEPAPRRRDDDYDEENESPRHNSSSPRSHRQSRRRSASPRSRRTPPPPSPPPYAQSLPAVQDKSHTPSPKNRHGPVG